MKIYNTSLYLLLAGLFVATSPSAFAVDDNAHKTQAHNHQTDKSKMRVLIDPNTQQLTLPSGKPLSKAMQNSLSRSAEGLKEKKLSNGSVALNLQGRFMHMAIAKKGKTNVTTIQCDTNIKKLAATLNNESALENNNEK